MELMTDATMGERIRYYRKQTGMTQKELAGLCGLSESAIRNYELGNRIPDWETLTVIAEQLRVNYYALADTDVQAIDGALHALFKMENIYGLYPKEFDGDIHFVFKESVPLSDHGDNLNAVLRDAGSLLQYRLRGYAKAAAMHDAGELTDEEYELWKSKSPLYLEDVRKLYEQRRQGEVKDLPEDVQTPGENPQKPRQRRKRKINNGH